MLLHAAYVIRENKYEIRTTAFSLISLAVISFSLVKEAASKDDIRGIKVRIETDNEESRKTLHQRTSASIVKRINEQISLPLPRRYFASHQ